MDKLPSVSQHSFRNTVNTEISQESPLVKDTVKPGTAIVVRDPLLKTVTRPNLPPVDFHESESQNELENNPIKITSPILISNNRSHSESPVTETTVSTKGRPIQGESASDSNTYPGFINFPARQSQEVASLFAGTENAYESKAYGVLINTFERNLEECFDNIKSQFLNEIKAKLDSLIFDCEQYAEQVASGKVDDRTKRSGTAGAIFQGYGGIPGDAYLKEYSRSVAVPTLAKFIGIVSAAYNNCTDPEMIQMIMEKFPTVLLYKSGEMRGDIAFNNKSEGCHSRNSVRYGKRAECVFFDPVHAYPGWHNLIYPMVKNVISEAYSKASNSTASSKAPLGIADKNFISALTSNAKFKITVDRDNRGPFLAGDDRRYLCELRGLEGSMSGAYRVSIKYMQLSEKNIEDLRPEDIYIYCFHDFSNGISDCIEKIMQWKLSEGTENLKVRLWNFLATMSKGSYFDRGQASITEWLMTAFSHVHKHKLCFPETWKADGNRLNLTPDLRALSAFDNNLAIEEFKAEVQLVADILQ